MYRGGDIRRNYSDGRFGAVDECVFLAGWANILPDSDVRNVRGNDVSTAERLLYYLDFYEIRIIVLWYTYIRNGQ